MITILKHLWNIVRNSFKRSAAVMCPTSTFFSVNCSKILHYFLEKRFQDDWVRKIYFSVARNEDFTSTMYRNHYQEKPREDLDTKIERVCVKLRNVYLIFSFSLF